jgi:hypothetical protein
MCATLCSCNPNQTTNQNLEEKTADLYRIYLNGSRDDAYRSTHQAISLIENAKFSPSIQEQQTFAIFLYSLDRFCGSNDLSDLDLIKARYWAVRSEELHGDSPAECNTYLEKFATGDHLFAFIKKWDKDANNGRDPTYMRPP